MPAPGPDVPAYTTYCRDIAHGSDDRVDYSGSMSLSVTRTAVLKELAGVGDKLAARSLTQPQRLALLRRQAELGDLRDALAENERRKRAAS